MDWGKSKKFEYRSIMTGLSCCVSLLDRASADGHAHRMQEDRALQTLVDEDRSGDHRRSDPSLVMERFTVRLPPARF
jgi:hypothetical protein